MAANTILFFKITKYAYHDQMKVLVYSNNGLILQCFVQNWYVTALSYNVGGF